MWNFHEQNLPFEAMLSNITIFVFFFYLLFFFFER